MFKKIFLFSIAGAVLGSVVCFLLAIAGLIINTINEVSISEMLFTKEIVSSFYLGPVVGGIIGGVIGIIYVISHKISAISHK